MKNDDSVVSTELTVVNGRRMSDEGFPLETSAPFPFISQ